MHAVDPLFSLPKSARQLTRPSEQPLAWVLDEDGLVWRIKGDEGAQVWASSRDQQVAELSCGADGALWIVLKDDCSTVHKLTEIKTVFSLAGFRANRGGAAVRFDVSTGVQKVAAGPGGAIWLITMNGEVWSRHPDGSRRCHSKPDFADEISVGVDGSVWIVSTESRFGGAVVKRLERGAREWFPLPAPAAATKIAVAPDGMAWSINTRGEIWRLHPAGGGNLAECQVSTECRECLFNAHSLVASEIAVTSDGTVWTIGSLSGKERPQVMWLADPHRRRYEIVPTTTPPRRICASVLRQ